MRKILKICGITMSGMLTIFLVYIGLLLYPGILFANHVELGNFTIHSNHKFGNELEIALRDIQAAISTSEIYDESLKHDIYFGYGNKIFHALQIKPALTYNRSWPPYLSEIITFRKPDFRANTLSHPQHLERSVNLRQIISHEVVHSLLNSKLGTWRNFHAPIWKIEGYCDYIAASTSTFSGLSYNFQASVKRILSQDLSWLKDDEGNFTHIMRSQKKLYNIRNEQGDNWPTCYYISRVLWEYLIDVKGLTFDEVMSPDVTDSETLAELIAAYGSGNLGL